MPCFPRLQERTKQRVRTSAGARSACSHFARGMLLGGFVLLIDEPSPVSRPLAEVVSAR